MLSHHSLAYQIGRRADRERRTPRGRQRTAPEALASLGGVHDLAGQDADLLDLRLDAVAGLEEVAGRCADAVGGPSRDDVARPERHALREHLDALGDGENHRGGVTLLTDLTVDPKGDTERL